MSKKKQPLRLRFFVSVCFWCRASVHLFVLPVRMFRPRSSALAPRSGKGYRAFKLSLLIGSFAERCG